MTPREPDRYEAKARELDLSGTQRSRVAAALRQAADDALNEAAQECAKWSDGTKTYLIAEKIRALASPAAAPAAEPRDVVTGTARETYAGIDFTRGSEPVAPAPFHLAKVAAHDLLQADRRAVQSIDGETRRKLAAKLLAGLAGEAASKALADGGET